MTNDEIEKMFDEYKDCFPVDEQYSLKWLLTDLNKRGVNFGEASPLGEQNEDALRRGKVVVPDGWQLVPKSIVEDILAISHEYYRQVQKDGYFDTPGGIENAQDAFDYINKWALALPAAPTIEQGE